MIQVNTSLNLNNFQLPATKPDLANLDATIFEAKPIFDSSFKLSDLYLSLAIKRGVRSCTQYYISKTTTYDSLSTTYKNFLSSLESVTVTIDWKHSIKKPCWKHAIEEEMRALMKNNKWEITELPPDKKLVGCKWVFTVKYRANRAIERYKTRPMAKWFT